MANAITIIDAIPFRVSQTGVIQSFPAIFLGTTIVSPAAILVCRLIFSALPFTPTLYNLNLLAFGV